MRVESEIDFDDSDMTILKVAKDTTFVPKLGTIADWFMRLKMQEGTYDKVSKFDFGGQDNDSDEEVVDSKPLTTYSGLTSSA